MSLFLRFPEVIRVEMKGAIVGVMHQRLKLLDDEMKSISPEQFKMRLVSFLDVLTVAEDVGIDVTEYYEKMSEMTRLMFIIEDIQNKVEAREEQRVSILNKLTEMEVDDEKDGRDLMTSELQFRTLRSSIWKSKACMEEEDYHVVVEVDVDVIQAVEKEEEIGFEDGIGNYDCDEVEEVDVDVIQAVEKEKEIGFEDTDDSFVLL